MFAKWSCWVIALSMAAQTWSPSNEATRPVTRASVFPARDNPTWLPAAVRYVGLRGT
jgi:hypothetical protein